MIADRLREHGVSIGQAEAACVTTQSQPFPWLQAAMVAGSMLAAATAIAVVARRPRRVVNLFVRCEAIAEECMRAVRRALASTRAPTARPEAKPEGKGDIVP